MSDLDAIKVRIEKWKRLKEKTPAGKWEVDANGIAEETEGWLIGGESFEYGDAVLDFIAYAHNTPIEDDVLALIAEVERLTNA